jgi:hypothetical protein
VKTPEEIIAFIARRIGQIYYRPLMYAETSAALDLVLRNYHELWAEITDNQELLDAVRETVGEHQFLGSTTFARRYSLNNPMATEEEIADYVVKQWRIISYLTKVPIPYSELRQVHAHNPQLIEKLFGKKP